MRKSPVIERLEHEHGKPLLEVLRSYATQGYSRREAADAIGVHNQTLAKFEQRNGLEVGWPANNAGNRRKRAYQKVGPKLRDIRRESGLCIVLDDGGVERTLREACELRGLNYRTVYDRWKAGKRPPELWATPHQTQGKAPDMYRVGYSMSDWECVLAYANERGVKAASLKFGLPHGAITAMQQGDWEKVA